MPSPIFLVLLAFIFFYSPPAVSGKEIPKIAVWDLASRSTPQAHAQELTSFVVSEITKLKKERMTARKT